MGKPGASEIRLMLTSAFQPRRYEACYAWLCHWPKFKLQRTKNLVGMSVLPCAFFAYF